MMLYRLLFLCAFAMASMLPCAASAKPPKDGVPVTCREAVDMAEKSDRDWRSADGDANFHYIDAASIKTMDQLRAALTAAKQQIPLVHGGDFSGWDFRNQAFAVSGVCFDESNLSKSHWEGVNAYGNGFINTDLSGARFDNAKAEYVLLREADLTGTVMLGADVFNGRLDGGWGGALSNWDLTGANMKGFQFDCGITVGDGCALDRDGVKFTGANLEDADISMLPFWGQADYSGAIFARTTISPRQLSDLKSANIAGWNNLEGGDQTVSLTAAQIKILIEQAGLGVAEADKASFDCARASSGVEQMICGEYGNGLRRQDRQLADLYSYIRPKNPGIAASQKAWIGKRNACKDDGCVSDLYDARIDELAKLLGEIQILEPGQTALFIDDDMSFPPSFTDDPLYAKITPVLVGASMSEVVLSRAKDGGYTIMGEAVGGNAHICSVQGDGARYNPSTGWFSVENAAIFRMIGDDLEFVGGGHPDDEKYPGSGDYVSCGARAVLGSMRMIKADAKTLNSVQKMLASGEG